MKSSKTHTRLIHSVRGPWHRSGQQGFTLVELLVAMVVGAIAMLAIYSVYVSISESYTTQRDLAAMQQNLRAAMFMIKSDLRNTGRNGKMDGNAENALVVSPSTPPINTIIGTTNLGIIDAGLYQNDADSMRGYPSLTMRSGYDTDATPDGEAELNDDNATHVISYQVMDLDGDGRRELRRWDSLSPRPAWDLVFDGIEDISFAFAYDEDNDLALDRMPAPLGGNATIIWGTNTDNQIGLDVNADNNRDGDINDLDDSDGDDWIDITDGGLGRQIPLDRIRAVRIWLLARSRFAYPGYRDTATYVLGHKVLDMNDAQNANRAGFRHKLLTGAVALQNHKMN